MKNLLLLEEDDVRKGNACAGTEKTRVLGDEGKGPNIRPLTNLLPADRSGARRSYLL
jgi:hypothetical protein